MLNSQSFGKNRNETKALFAIGSIGSAYIQSNFASDMHIDPMIHRPVLCHVDSHPELFTSPIDYVVGFFNISLFILRDGTILGRGFPSNAIKPLNISAELAMELRGCTVLDVGISGSSAMILFSNHHAYGIGGSVASRFGAKDHSDLFRATDRDKHGRVIAMALGYSNTYFLNDKHEVFSYGDRQGLGRDNSVDKVDYSSVLDTGDFIVHLSGGYAQCVAISQNGSAFFHGFNNYGEGAVVAEPATPVKVTWFSERNIKLAKAHCGIFHTMWLTTTNTLYCTGRNEERELGVGSTEGSCKVPVKVEWNTPIVDILCGGSCCVAMTSDGRILFSGSLNYLCGDDGTCQPVMKDILEVFQEKAENFYNWSEFSINEVKESMIEFEKLYRDPSYEKCFSAGSSHHYIAFKKSEARAIPRLYAVFSSGKFNDIHIHCQ